MKLGVWLSGKTLANGQEALSSILSTLYIFKICVCMFCLHECSCRNASLVPEESEECWISGTEVEQVRSCPVGTELNAGPLCEHPVLLTTEPVSPDPPPPGRHDFFSLLHAFSYWRCVHTHGVLEEVRRQLVCVFSPLPRGFQHAAQLLRGGNRCLYLLGHLTSPSSQPLKFLTWDPLSFRLVHPTSPKKTGCLG